MGRALGRQAPALIIAAIALLAALGGSVYAAAKLNGRQVKRNSLPGNRVRIGSLPANRIRPGSLPGDRLAPGSVTGTQVDAATLAEVPRAAHAESADSARSAGTALNADSAADAETVNGHAVGCGAGTRPFAGACWEITSHQASLSATAAASVCAAAGGELPGALTLAAFSQEPGIELAAGDEWSREIASFTGPNAFSVATVSSTSVVGSALSTASKHFRCVIPLLT